MTELTSLDPVAVPTDRAEVDVIPGGPVLVRGAGAVRGPDGTEHPCDRPVVAVCACGLTQRAPFCDGTHKVARR